LFDGRYAKDYYADINAGDHLVYPDNGLRILDNKAWGLFRGSQKKLGTQWINSNSCTYLPTVSYWSTYSTAYCYSHNGRIYYSSNSYIKKSGSTFWSICSCYDEIGWH